MNNCHTKSTRNKECITQFPFSAIVGQETLKKALLLNCINPKIGGILISGEKGTAKSTIVRSLGNLIPENKVITLPLNTTEDMLLGGLDLEKALKDGVINFHPGVLSKAHKGILYIDEVNLLSESILNSILDAASSGVCKIEREGISYSYPSEFILIGSMNAEEGSLRPQILDRFGFFIDVKAEMNKRARMEIVKKRLSFESNPNEFASKYIDEETFLSEQIENAKKLVKSTNLTDSTVKLVADICQQSFIAGHRGDLAFCNGIMAHAALEARKHITREDIEFVQDLALAHRIRSVNQPMPEDENPEDHENKEENQQNQPEQQQDNEPSNNNDMEDSTEESQEENQSNDQPEEEELFEIADLELETDIVESIKDKKYRTLGSGRRSKTRTSSKHGHYVKVKLPQKDISDLALDATLRAAAPYQKLREKNGTAVSIHQQDIRVKIREKRIGNTILFLLDTSGSMGINRRMAEAKAAVFELLKESYKKRDTVGLMRFNQQDASLELQPTRSLDLAHNCLKDIKIGGKTPLAEGIKKSVELMKALMAKNSEIVPVVVLLSDGRANATTVNENPMKSALKEAAKASKENIRFIVIDTESGFIRLKLAKKLADTLQAEYYYLEDLKKIKSIINNP